MSDEILSKKWPRDEKRTKMPLLEEIHTKIYHINFHTPLFISNLYTEK